MDAIEGVSEKCQEIYKEMTGDDTDLGPCYSALEVYACTVKPVLETTYIKQCTAVGDQYADKTPLLKSTQ